MTPLQTSTVSGEILHALEEFDSCTISNAIEHFNVRTRNEGFVNGSVRCMFPQIPPRVGFAATLRVRTSATPIRGRLYYHRSDWWEYLLTIPAPRFIVALDVDPAPGLGALFGEIHASISVALDCTAYLTNGAVRDLPGMEAAGLQVFAGSISVSHAYAHVIDFGEAVEVGGLQIKPGDLLHGDQHGVIAIPLSIAGDIPGVARRVQIAEKELIAFCRSPEFSLEKLSEKMRTLLHSPERDNTLK